MYQQTTIAELFKRMLNYILLILVREQQHKNKYLNVMGGANKPHPFYKIKQGVSAMYITKKDYFDKRGIDLEIELKGSVTDNTSKKVEIFISQIEEWLINYLASKYDFTEKNDNSNKLSRRSIQKSSHISNRLYSPKWKSFSG